MLSLERKKLVNIRKLEGIIESILFTMGDSVELGKLSAVTQCDEETLRQVIGQMILGYQEENRGIQITMLEDAVQMCSKAENYEYLVQLAKQPKKYVLTEVMLEVLSIIAYKQPVTRIEVEKIRGVKSDHAISKLVEYELVCELGRMDAPGRPLLFGTTEEFLRRFNVASVQELPSINQDQMADFQSEAEDEAQLKLDI